MRPLHRPMFRYGGPIKEGVMSGIREPRANGGSMRNRALLVGNPAFPMQNGRALHSQNLQGIFDVAGQAAKKTIKTNPVKVLNPGKKLQFFKNLALAGYNPIKNFYRKQMSKLDMPPRGVDVGGKLGPGYAGVGQRPLSMFEKMKYFARKNPKTTGVGVGVGMTSGAIPATVGGIGTLVEKIPLQVADLLVKDKYFDQDKWMKENYPDGFIGAGWNKLFGKDKKEDEKELTANELRIQQLEKLLAAKEEPVVPEKSDAEIRKEQIQKYRDIMDIKGMNKRAAYDSLIDASKLIQESGDFKGDIKSGKLINDIIQATSKAYDKPAKTKDAIDTLILKGEIEKDIKASDPSNEILNRLREVDIKTKTKALNPSFNNLKAVYSKDNKGQKGIDLAAGEYATNQGVDFKGNIISKNDFKDILKDLKTKTKGLDEDLIIKNYTEEIIKNQEAPDGAYTVGDKIVIIKDKQVIAVE